MKVLMGFEPVHNGKINVCSAASDSSFLAIQDDIKKSSDIVGFFVSPQLILQRESSDHGFFKENYHLTITFRYSMEKDGPTFPGVQLFPGGGGQINL